MKKIKIFIGKGGVGKSTCSSLFAINCLSKYEKVLLVSMDPAHNLHDIFQKELNNKPQKVYKNLYVSESDIAKKSKEYLKSVKNTVSGVYHYQQSLNLDKYFSILKYSPGTEEYSSLLVLEEYILNKKFDCIIIDTPPTALTMKTLALPQINNHWINALSDMRKEIIDKKNAVARIKKDPLEKVSNDQIFIRLKKMKDRYDFLNERLSDPNLVEFVLVINQDQLSVSESQLIKKQMDELNFKIGKIVINKTEEKNFKKWEDSISKIFPSAKIKNIPIQNFPLIGIENLEKLKAHWR